MATHSLSKRGTAFAAALDGRKQAGMNAASNNAISNVSILGNTLLNPRTAPTSPTTGISLIAVDSYGSAVVGTGNSLNNILIQTNTIQRSVPPGNINFGGGNPIYAIQSAGFLFTREAPRKTTASTDSRSPIAT